MPPCFKKRTDIACPVQPHPMPPEFPLGKDFHTQIIPEGKEIPYPGVLGGLEQPVGLRAMPAVPFPMPFQQGHGCKQQKLHLAARWPLAEHPRGNHTGIVGYEQRPLRQVFEQMGKKGMRALPRITIQHEKPRCPPFTGVLGYTFGRQFVTVGREEKIGFGLWDGIHGNPCGLPLKKAAS